MTFIEWVSLLITVSILYPFFLYPVLLLFCGWIVRFRPGTIPGEFPSVSLIIVSHPGEPGIEERIRNALSLSFPEKFEIIVVFDGKSARTRQIVENYYRSGVVFIKVPRPSGKTFCLNVAAREAEGDILVFSDANTEYRDDALQYLVSPFSDRRIGCVSGILRYRPRTCAGLLSLESSYMSWDIFLRRLESKLGILAGGIGPILAVRKSLYRELPPRVQSDLYLPLLIQAAGYRGWFEERAVCEEELPLKPGDLFRSKRRIVQRAALSLSLFFRSVLFSGLDNPSRKIGLCFSLVSHKILKWLLFPLFFSLYLISAVGCRFEGGYWYPVFFTGTVLILWGTAGILSKSRLIAAGGYCLVSSLGAFFGLLDALTGRHRATWNPPRTRRVNDGK